MYMQTTFHLSPYAQEGYRAQMVRDKFPEEDSVLYATRSARFEELLTVQNEDGKDTYVVSVFRLLDTKKRLYYECPVSEDPASKYAGFSDMICLATDRTSVEAWRLEGCEFELTFITAPLVNRRGTPVHFVHELIGVELSKPGPWLDNN